MILKDFPEGIPANAPGPETSFHSLLKFIEFRGLDVVDNEPVAALRVNLFEVCGSWVPRQLQNRL